MQYIHFKHDDIGMLELSYRIQTRMMIPDTVRYNVKSVNTL